MARILVGQTVYGNAAQFVANAAKYLTRSAIAATDNFTISLWAYLNVNNIAQDLFSNGANDGNGYSVRITSSGILQADIAFVANYNTSVVVTASAWHHIVLRRQSGTWQYFLDGSTAGGTASNNPNSPGSFLTVGASRSSGGTVSRPANANIDEVRFYTRALSNGEILSLYNRGLNINSPDVDTANLSARWKLDESSGNAADSSGNGLTLTNNGTVTFGTGIVQLSNVPARQAAGSRTLAGARTLAA